MPDPEAKETRQSPQPASPAQAASPGDRSPDRRSQTEGAVPPPAPELVSLSIDGQEISVAKGTLIVEAARRLGIEIPVFCYHHKLDPVGACRLCLCEISPGPPKPQTACTTPVAQGMKVQTNTQLAVSARADILEYELVNHPLDCPICDKGGECPLQDYTFRHGYPTSRIDAPRLHFQKPIPLSPRIALDRERCVLCYRCTRYYDEIAWEQELTTDQRGAHAFITSQFGEPLQSVFSGNIIDLCPVGALTSRVWRFESRPWDMNHTFSVCSRCSVGCNVTLWERRHQLVRVTSHENDAIDDGWICDRGRFEYTEVNAPERLRQPQVGGQPATWEASLQAVAEGLKGRRLGISLRRDVTNEELYLLSRLLAGPLQGARVAMENRTCLPPPQGETLRIEELDTCKAIVVLGADPEKETPIVDLRIKKAVKKLGAKLLLVNAADLDLDRWGDALHIRPGDAGLAATARQLIGHELLQSGPVGIVHGHHPADEAATAELVAAAQELAGSYGAKVMPLYQATNERGALITGVVGKPDDLVGCDAVLCFGPPAVPLPSSARFVVVWDTVLRPAQGRPDVILPALSFAETQGSYTNLEGRVQFLRPPLEVRQPLRETWDVLCDLGVRLGLAEFSRYAGIFQIQRAAAATFPDLASLADPPAPEAPPRPVLLGASRP
ncbi:MAG: 2Fe-2S iron-sulfur cluster-binding protein [Candidatus Dormibacteraeota bacterium]|nr:2Fe-2S iron-sulfur cluster-binding protein [Candidatus Dormibacteraeota bacterium]